MKKMKKTLVLCIVLILTFVNIFAIPTAFADEPASTEPAQTEGENAEGASPEAQAGLEAASAVELPAPTFELISETDKVALYADKTLGEIKFVDKVNGTEWYSNPQDKSSTIDIGEYKERLYSQFSIEYAQAYNLLTTNSSIDCLKYTRSKSVPCLSTKVFNKLSGFGEGAGHEDIALCESLKNEPVDGGIKFIYTMPKFGFKVVIQYTVKDDYLEAKVLTDESILSSINMEKQVVSGFQTRITEVDYNITRIDLLPMFGAARRGEQGYMFLPDESGVIVNYDNGKENYEEYDMPVYGRYYDTKEYARRKPGVFMPVFGNVNSNGTLMGVVTEGDSVAFMRAFVSGKTTEFNNAYSSAQICIIEKNVGETDGIPYASRIIGNQNYAVRYYSLGNENGGYVGMANRYRDYLISDKGMKASGQKDSQIFLDVYGQVNKDKNILGVPVVLPEVLTGYEDLINITEELKDKGVENPTVRYTNWQSRKNDGKVAENVKFSAYLGGKSNFNKLKTYMADNGVNFYPNVDYVNFSKGTLKYSKFSNAIKKLDQSPTTIIRNRVPVKLGNKWYLLRPSTLKKGFGNFVEDYKKLGIEGIAIDSIANMVYSDYKKGSDVRATTQGVWEEVLKNAKEKTGKIMVDSANAYAFPYADAILTTPSTDAYCEVADKTVPFYQMVLHGYVNYGTEALNLSAEPEVIRLKGIETGAALTYSVFASEASAVKDTYMDYLFSSNFDIVKDEIVEYYKADKAYYDSINGKKIVNHEFLADGVTRTSFENGVKVAVNFTENDVTLEDGTVVAAKSYKVQ